MAGQSAHTTACAARGAGGAKGPRSWRARFRREELRPGCPLAHPPLPTCLVPAADPGRAAQGPLLGFAVAEGDLCPDPDLASDMRFLSVGLALIGLLSPIVILCGCMLPITLCLGDISESKVQRYFFILRLLGNGVLFGWSIYGMSFVYTNPLIDTCLDPVRTVSDAASAATRCTRAGAGIASGRSGGRGGDRAGNLLRGPAGTFAAWQRRQALPSEPASDDPPTALPP